MLSRTFARLAVGAVPAGAAALAFSTSCSGATSFYDIVETTSSGESFAFEQLRGSVVYGVNVASR